MNAANQSMTTDKSNVSDFQSVTTSSVTPNSDQQSPKPRKIRIGALVATCALAGGIIVGLRVFETPARPAAAATPPPVVVSTPIEKNIEARLQFLGQFSAVEQVDLKAQVGGTLTEIGFKDGEVVRKGAHLFTIDPTPYQIKLEHAVAQTEAARARLVLSNLELDREKRLQRKGVTTAENLDNRVSEQLSAQAALDDAQAAVRDAQFDLNHCQITAPFTGKIGTHLTSIGNLIAGSRGASSPTTLLATIVSLDPIYLNFDLSEADFMSLLRQREKLKGALSNKVIISLSDENAFTREGTLDFVDNQIDRSSGTIHARATIPNKDLLLTPGGFARVRIALSAPEPALLVPDASVVSDQDNHLVLTVSEDNTVVAKLVTLGDLRDGLRVIRSGLAPTDKVIIDGIVFARPGSKVTPTVGAIKPQTVDIAKQ
jgi:RND family efflux transporter MFP subunit